jgi:anti-anti-sigma regulatory factor
MSRARSACQQKGREERVAVNPHGRTVVVELAAGMTAAAVRQVCARVTAAAAAQHDVVCLVHSADLTVVDALARVELLRRRLGLRCRVRATQPAVLAGLLELTGLRNVCPDGSELLGELEPPEQ